jgi:radical SAM-linked protein
MTGLRHRLRFEKAGDLRFLSHLDLNRTMERLFRRAAVPFAFTGGFHPTPKIVFALSLALGTIGRDEVLEIETTEPFETTDLFNRLNGHAPAGLTFKSAKPLAEKVRGFPRRALYALPIEAAAIPAADATIAALLQQDRVWAPRQKPHPRQVNIRPYLRAIHTAGDHVHFDIWVTQSGTARIDELIALLRLPDPLITGAIIERTTIELHDETPADVHDAPPDGPPELKPLEHVPDAVSGDDEPIATATWGLSPNGPEVE